jgi:hypothetical protein
VKREVLRRVALKPKWVAHFWGIWGADRVPDPIRLDALVLTHKFNESAAPNFLKVYDATIGYAGLSESDKETGGEENTPLPRDETPKIEVGDFILSEVSGKSVFPKPSRVRAIQEFDGKPWVFVDDSEAGIQMEHVRLEQKGSGAAELTAPRLPIPPLETTPERAAPPKGGDPYRVSFTPSGGLEGSFRLDNAADLDELVKALAALKFFFKKASEITKPKLGQPPTQPRTLAV